MHYYGTRLSENISRREPEGYLLCLNVPVARTGTQEYLPEELGDRKFYEPSGNGYEKTISEYLRWVREDGGKDGPVDQQN